MEYVKVIVISDAYLYNIETSRYGEELYSEDKVDAF